MSADIRHEPILAYNNTGTFLSSDNIPPGLAIWFDMTINKIEMLRENVVNNDSMGLNGWISILNTNNNLSQLADSLKPNSLLNHTVSSSGCPVFWEQKGPLLKTEWGQGCTYNSQIGNLGDCNSSFQCNRKPTGCVATATAQIMKYHNQPSTIWNFQTMPLKRGNTTVAAMMQNLGVNLNMNYTCDGSSASTQKSCDVLKNDYNYANAKHGSYTHQRMVDDIFAHRPGMVSGCAVQNVNRKKFWKIWKVKYTYDICHQWCYDGLAFLNDCGKIYNQIMHMNWGWYEVDPYNFTPTVQNFNGWYNVTNWEIPNSERWNFKFAIDMVYEIKWQ